MRRILIALAALSLMLAACGAPQTQYDTAEIARVVTQAIAGDGSSVEILTVQVEKSEGDYMRARAIPVDTAAYDSPYVFLKHEAGGWRVLNYGTAFLPENYAADGIPESLWVGN